MSNPNYSPRRLQDQLDVFGVPSAGTVPVFNALTGRFEFTSAPMPPAPGSDTELLGNVAGAVAGLPGLNYVANALRLGGVDLGATRLNIFTGAAGTPVAVQSNALGSGGTLLALTVGNTPAIAYGGYTSGSAGAFIADMIQNNGNGNAIQDVLVLGNGDPFVRLSVNDGTVWSAGLDNSDSDAYVVSAASVLGTNNALRLDPSTLQAMLYGNVHATSANVNHDTILESTGASHYSRLQLKTAARNWSFISWGNFPGDGFSIVDETSAAERLRIDSLGTVYPGGNNTQSLGSANWRWSGVHAGSGDFNGNISFATDNAYDIGASGANRPRTGYFGTGIGVGSGAPDGNNPVYVQNSVAGYNSITVRNTNAVGWAIQRNLNDAGSQVNVGISGTTRPSYGSLVAGGAFMYADSASGIVIMADAGGAPIKLAAGGNAAQWQLTGSGNLEPVTDNAYDIGASGANRPRSGYFGTEVRAGTSRIYDPFPGSGYAGFGHKDLGYTVLTDPNGSTFIGCEAARSINFRQSNATKWYFDTIMDFRSNGVQSIFVGGNGEIDGNLTLGGAGDFQSASKAIYLANAAGLPAGTPSGGGLLVNDNGTLKWYTPLGNVRTLAAA